MLLKPDEFLDLLCCPVCRGEFTPGPESLHCAVCRHDYPIVDGIPVLLPDISREQLEEHTRYWDAPEKAILYDTKVEGDGDAFGIYNHQSELHALTRHYDAANMDLVLDAGCGNGRFFETFLPGTVGVGADASLNLLRLLNQRPRGRKRHLVCCDLEHLPFKNELFGTVISCRVLQHLPHQEQAVAEMSRVVRTGGDLILELYNTWNPKTLYKAIRMNPKLARVLNAPFRWLFHSMSPFADWGLAYDRYTSWDEAYHWMRAGGMGHITGRGVGFGYHKYLFQPFYIHALLNKKAPELLRRYYRGCFALEKGIGGLPGVRQVMEKFVIRGRKGGPEVMTLWEKGAKTLRHQYHTLPLFNLEAEGEMRRQREGLGRKVESHLFHMEEALGWLCRAQDATPDRGVARGYSTGWNPHFGARGWQPSYPETTGYIITTLLQCADHLDRPDLRRRAMEMADWEIAVQMSNGAVMGGTIDQPASPAVFNTGQVILGWLDCHRHIGEQRHLDAAVRAGAFLVAAQSEDGGWRMGNSRFADQLATTYNARVGWALLMLGKTTGNDIFTAAGRRNIDYVLSRQRGNGWFEDNCLSDSNEPLLHTICYAIEGLLGAAQVLGDRRVLEQARLAADSLMAQVREDGRIAGRLDDQWRPAVPWDCLTGSAQLAHILLTLAKLTGDFSYRRPARRLLAFLKSTQNCIPSASPGLRGGIHGSYPFDGDYGRFQVLNWATKFFIDALLLDLELSGH